MITSLHTKIGRGWVTRRFDDLLARSRILADAILLVGVSSSILLEHEVEEVHLLDDVVDGHGGGLEGDGMDNDIMVGRTQSL